jgi:hypothetical protein
MKSKDTKGLRKSAAKSVKPRTTSVAAPKPKAGTAEPIAAKAKGAARIPQLKIPPILLEGDAPPTQSASGPGPALRAGSNAHRRARRRSQGGIAGILRHAAALLGGARSALALCALGFQPRTTEEIQRSFGRRSFGAARLSRGGGRRTVDTNSFHPESRTWFVPVPAAGAKYLAELGYHDAAGKWVSLARSGGDLYAAGQLVG